MSIDRNILLRSIYTLFYTSKYSMIDTKGDLRFCLMTWWTDGIAAL